MNSLVIFGDFDNHANCAAVQIYQIFKFDHKLEMKSEKISMTTNLSISLRFSLYRKNQNIEQNQNDTGKISMTPAQGRTTELGFRVWRNQN
jgi:hypothetical protein